MPSAKVFLFLKFFLPKVSGLTLGKDFLYGGPTLGKDILFFLFFEPSFFMVLQYIILNSILKFGLILTFLYIFLNLFRYFDFYRYSKFELQVHEIMQCSILKNIIYGIWCMLSS